MNETFNVGEIAIMVGLQIWPEYNNQECEIVGGLEMRRFWADRGHTGIKQDVRYRARIDGLYFCIRPQNLRKKQPPPKREETGSWDVCPWQPAKVVSETAGYWPVTGMSEPA